LTLGKFLSYINWIFIPLVIALLFMGSVRFFTLAYIVVFIIVVVRTLMTPGRRKTRRHLVLAYTAILIVQITMLDSVLYSEAGVSPLPEFVFRRVLGLVFLCLPMLVSRYVASVKYTHYYLPPVGETAAVGISELISTAAEIKRTAGFISESKKKLSIDNLKSLAYDMTRHDSFHYVNSRSLTDE
jgi:hypothetical protein